MIRVTKQQRANAIEARDVMWPSVPPENVMPELGSWRRGGRGKPTCGTVACFGGWCAWWPPFREQGIGCNWAGAPTTQNPHVMAADEQLFGEREMFSIRGYCPADATASKSCTDHELVTHRLNWLIANSEVIE